MLTLIVLCILAIGFLTVAVKKDSSFCAITGFILALAFVVSILTLINIKYRLECEKDECLNAIYIAQTYDNGDKDRIEALDLMQLVVKTNNTISRHHVLSKSPWVGLWYSKEIGDLPKIQLKQVNE